MPALEPKQYARFCQMLEELGPEVDGMKEVPKSFMSDMVAKQKEFGERMFVSIKQFQWVERLHEEFIGDTDHSEDDGPPSDDPRFNDEGPGY